MNLIDRYILAVGKHLPRRNREDLQAEIRTLIDDMLADQYPDQEPDEEQVADVLRQLGKPEKVAASYHTERYLVGPAIYPAFMTVFKIVLAAMSGTILLSLVPSYLLESSGQSIEHLFTLLLRALPGYVSGVFTAFGILVIVFHFLERWQWKSIQEELDSWDPKDLPEMEEEPFNPVMTAVGTTILVLLAAVLNFFPQLIGMFVQVDGDWLFMPLLGENFFQVLPYLNIGIGLNVGLNILVLSQGGWRKLSQWLKFAVGIFDFLVLLMVLRSQPLIDFNPAFASFYPFSAQQVAELGGLYEIINFSIVLALSVAMVVIGIMWIIELVKKIFRGSESLPVVTRT